MKLALIGCGAIAELGYLPALPLARSVETVLLVDRDLSRARDMAARFGIQHASADVADALKMADATCVALPHNLHEPIGRQLLDGGVHVLMEKPLAVTTAECDSLITAAGTNRRVLSIAMMRRYSPSNMLAKTLLTSGTLGRVRSFHVESGSGEVWPTRSPHLLSRQDSGGGVLMASGCHDLDLITWLFGPVASVRCFSDSLHNAEANFTIEMKMESGVEGRLEVSRTRTLRNHIVVEAEHATMEFPPLGETAKISFAGNPPVTLEGQLEIAGQLNEDGGFFARIMAAQLENFAAAVHGRSPPMVSGASARATIDLIERCYACAEPMELPWRRPIAVTRSTTGQAS